MVFNVCLTCLLVGHTDFWHPLAKVAKLVLTPLALINRFAALVPPPRTHRHRYCGVLAPNINVLYWQLTPVQLAYDAINIIAKLQ